MLLAIFICLVIIVVCLIGIGGCMDTIIDLLRNKRG